jgi:acyl carrier protein
VLFNGNSHIDIKIKILEDLVMLERIEKVLREHKGESDLSITVDTTFEELELDSLDTVDLIMNLEEEFDVTIEMNEPIKTIGDLMEIIEKAS